MSRHLAFAVMIAAVGLAAAPDRLRAADDAGGGSRSGEETSAEFDRLLEKGRSAYNANDWKRAAKFYREAAQVAPRRPKPYRNLARAYFMEEEYGRAAAYYDIYLKRAPEADDLERVERERRLASHRAGDRVWTRPTAQKRVLKSLRKRLRDGRAYTDGGGGAWALYRTLLRTGYVHPDLARIQDRLREKLLDEFDRVARPKPSRPVPVRTLQEWQRQQKRLEAARSLADTPKQRRSIDHRTRITDAARALLDGQSGEAAKSAAAARKAFPEREYLTWMRTVALVGAKRHEEARAEIEQMRDQSPPPTRSERRYLRALEAIVDQRNGDLDEATDLYLRVLETRPVGAPSGD